MKMVLKTAFNDAGEEIVTMLAQVKEANAQGLTVCGLEYIPEEKKDVLQTVQVELPGNLLKGAQKLPVGKWIVLDAVKVNDETVRGTNISLSRRLILPTVNPKTKATGKKNFLIGDFVLKKSLYEKKNGKSNEEFVKELQEGKSFSGAVVIKSQKDGEVVADYFNTVFVDQKWAKNPAQNRMNACKILGTLPEKDRTVFIQTGDATVSEYNGKEYTNYFANGFNVLNSTPCWE